MKFLKIELTYNKHLVDLSSLINLHLNCNHHSTVLRVSSFTAISWLFLSILNYLSFSSIYTQWRQGSDFVFFSLLSDSYLKSVAAWLWCRRKSDVSFWTHLLPNLLSFSFLFPNLHFSSLLNYRLTPGSGHFSLVWWQPSQLQNSYCRAMHPTPLHTPPQWPFSTPPSPPSFPFPFVRRTKVTLLSVPSPFRESLVLSGLGWGADSHGLNSLG